MSKRLDNTLFQLKYTAKFLARQARKARKDEEREKVRLKKALQQENPDGARIYASNAIRKKNEALNLLRLSSRLDAVASRVETAVTMGQVTRNLAHVVQDMDKATKSMNLEQISRIMDGFETHSSDFDVQASYMEETMANTDAAHAPTDEIEELIKRAAEEVGVETEQNLGARAVPTKAIEGKEEDNKLAERLKALRPA